LKGLQTAVGLSLRGTYHQNNIMHRYVEDHETLYSKWFQLVLGANPLFIGL
jgi:hypothetical protein